jgi:glycosyltransferase involved in cell wall biosynthesis
MRVITVIPALNEGQSVGLVVKGLPRDLIDTIVVVDNGSTDATAARAEAAGAVVIRQPERGYGNACLAGIDEAMRRGADVVLFVDADFSDDPSDARNILMPILHREVDMVIGSRTLGERERGALLPQARFGNALACFLMRLFWGVRYTDLGPFRAITTEALRMLAMKDRTYGWTIEMQIKAAAAGLRHIDVPVAYRRRQGRSKITGTVSGTVKASAKILFTIGFLIVKTHLDPSWRSGLRTPSSVS